jgi:hypothetical protein
MPAPKHEQISQRIYYCSLVLKTIKTKTIHLLHKFIYGNRPQLRKMCVVGEHEYIELFDIFFRTSRSWTYCVYVFCFFSQSFPLTPKATHFLSLLCLM